MASKSKELFLFYLAAPRFGGWVNYTYHLAKSFKLMGYEPKLFCITERDENRVRPYYAELGYQNVSLATATGLAQHRKTFITAVGQDQMDQAAELLRVGASICIHDPTEMTPKLVDALAGRKFDVLRKSGQIITIRKKNVENMDRRGFRTTFIPHPYVRAPEGQEARDLHAVALSRLDWDKNTHVIVEANQTLLEPSRRVTIYGAPNRLYMHHKIEKQWPRWEEDYKGQFPKEHDASVKLARRARFVVDLSVIAGDGGGTQYTFLEAWDAGAVLVIHRKWLRPDDETMSDRVNCLAANDALELSQVLGTERVEELVQAGFRSLEKHRPEQIVPAYVEALGL